MQPGGKHGRKEGWCSQQKALRTLDTSCVACLEQAQDKAAAAASKEQGSLQATAASENCDMRSAANET